MTRAASWGAAALLLLSACAAVSGGGEAPAPAGYVVAPGDEFDIRLEANPSTGFQWRIGEPLDEAVVKLVGSDFVRGALPTATPAGGAGPGGAAAPASGQAGSAAPVERVGQGGIETWRFRAVAPGRTRIELVYGRPWEDDKTPARFVVYSVEVR